MRYGAGGGGDGAGSRPPRPGSAVELLLRAPDADREPLVLLCRRTDPARGRWGLPDSGEALPDSGEATRCGGAGVRRIAEAIGVSPAVLRVRGEQPDHAATGDRRVTTVVADTPEPIPGHAGGPEAELVWVREEELATLDLQPALAARWTGLRAAGTGLLVDAANVVGSRPDGWWRDRAGAAARLLREIAATAPAVLAVPRGGFRWVTRPVVVLEGAATRAPDVPGVEVVRAPGSGDDTIVDVARRGGDWVVVTADRGLRARLPPTTIPVGPATLRSWLTPPPPAGTPGKGAQ